MEDDVEDPMQAVLDAPVRPDCAGQRSWVDGQGGQKVATGGGDGAVALDAGLDHCNGIEAREPRLAGEAAFGGQPVHVVADPMAAGLDTAMVGIDGLERVAAGLVGA